MGAGAGNGSELATQTTTLPLSDLRTSSSSGFRRSSGNRLKFLRNNSSVPASGGGGSSSMALRRQRKEPKQCQAERSSSLLPLVETLRVRLPFEMRYFDGTQ